MKTLKTGIIVLLMLPLNSLLGQEGGQSPSCLDCHRYKITNQYVHSPSEEGCDMCHQSTGSEHPRENHQGFVLAEEIPELCFICHEKSPGSVQHAPVVSGDCMDCHSAHSSEYEGLLVTGPEPELCFSCHDMKSEISEKEVVHKAITDGKACNNCHNPHSSEFGQLLVKESMELCLSCHNKAIESEGRKIRNINLELKEGNMVHGPLEKEGCSPCHYAHASDNNSLLVASFPADSYVEAEADNFELCFVCHDSGILSSENAESSTGFRQGGTNLHFVHINGENGRNCNMCHSMHGSANQHLIADFVQFGEWQMPLNYEANDQGGSCSTGCHGKIIYRRTN
jgi:predicted CXXCH cytochrome family protein